MPNSPAHSFLSRPLAGEDERLRWAWDRYPHEYLDSYLVSGVEDPRINFQSILTRALIADTLFPGRFDVGKYHLNRLSVNRTVGLCLEHAANVEVVDVPRLVSSKFGYPAYHNSSARSIVIGV
ncbi:MAG: hypothetical protein NTZ09_12575 [Candidatus Hydrogenedentes bacterium]|nr:hypothetical protein [Candidatus Hydrogenedentota bacterium]